ncbi:MAG: metallophosphoesterase [Firmicutes bacterium]|nr:metallophosphoesterase [Bacillota bacterium]
MLKLWQFTDLHLHVRENPEELDKHPNQTALAQSEAIIDACLAAFLAEPGCGTLLLSGDLTQTGHPYEHSRMIEKLRQVQAAGKRVIAITASHDHKTLGRENCHLLREMYAEFGPNDAIALYEDGIAFVVMLEPGLRLLCINDHGRDRPPRWLPWALEQIEQAKAAGGRIFGMTHLPSLPPSPIYPLIEPRSLLQAETTRALADAGLPFMLTGHSHIHNIAPIVTPAGNPYWDVNTSALVGWPGKFRKLEIDGNTVRITGSEIPHIPAFGEMAAAEFLRETFDVVLRNIFAGWESDYELFARSIGTGIDPARVYKLKTFLKPLGKPANRITLGGLGALLACRSRITAQVRGLLLRDVLLEGMRNIYAGTEPYGPETGLGQAFLAYGRRLKFLGKKLGIADFPAFMLSLVYDDSPDDEVTIHIGEGLP